MTASSDPTPDDYRRDEKVQGGRGARSLGGFYRDLSLWAYREHALARAARGKRIVSRMNVTVMYLLRFTAA